MSRIYLNVPYAQKDNAKSRGARWDSTARKWYVPSDANLATFQSWLPPPSLTIELVPQTCWYSNVRSHVSKEDWDKLRQRTYSLANNRCEVCGGIGPQHPVECHEVWHYDDEQHIQKLVRLIALCPSCHEVKHMGYANTQGRGQIAQRHLAKVNGWTPEQTKVYVKECFQLWEQRSQHEWRLDISYLEQLGILASSERSHEE
jgi:transposase-like protein